MCDEVRSPNDNLRPVRVLPAPRGPISERLLEALIGEPDTDGEAIPAALPAQLDEEDHQLSLYLCYELQHGGLPGVAAEWEWSPELLRLRAALERRYRDDLDEQVPRSAAVEPERVGEMLFRLAEEDDSPSLGRYLETRGTAEEFRELVIHRSAYQLKEADPHTWAIPRLRGPAKSALIEIQFDEYGSGRWERMHSVLFAKTMRALGLDDTEGAYLDRLPAVTLATVNLVTMLGLHRQMRGALVGHLAMFEITSALPNRRLGNALRRLGLDSADAVDFYDEHVEADSVHENIAAFDLGQALAVAEPELTADILWGARALLAVEGRWSGALLAAWDRGESSLLSARDVVEA